jgi:hypothetical protein
MGLSHGENKGIEKMNDAKAYRVKIKELVVIEYLVTAQSVTDAQELALGGEYKDFMLVAHLEAQVLKTEEIKKV